MCQPPYSPDFNVLDLGYFRAIQTLQHKEAPKTVDELVRAVGKIIRRIFTHEVESNIFVFTIVYERIHESIRL